MLSAKQSSIKHHFLSLWYDSTCDWIQVFRNIGEHANHYAYGPVDRWQSSLSSSPRGLDNFPGQSLSDIKFSKSSRQHSVFVDSWWILLPKICLSIREIPLENLGIIFFLIIQHVLFILPGLFVRREVSGHTAALFSHAASRIFFKIASCSFPAAFHLI